jgi:hypothetical protein
MFASQILSTGIGYLNLKFQHQPDPVVNQFNPVHIIKTEFFGSVLIIIPTSVSELQEVAFDRFPQPNSV